MRFGLGWNSTPTTTVFAPNNKLDKFIQSPCTFCTSKFNLKCSILLYTLPVLEYFQKKKGKKRDPRIGLNATAYGTIVGRSYKVVKELFPKA